MGTYNKAIHVIEMFVIFVLLILRVAVLIANIRVHTFWYKERCMSMIIDFIRKGGCVWSHESYPSQPMTTLRNQVTVTGIRDGHIVNIPQTLLVSGDIIQLNFSHPSPAHVKVIKPQFHHDGILLPDELIPGEIPRIRYRKKQNNPLTFKQNVRAWYKVTHTPFLWWLRKVDLFSYPVSHLCRQKQTIEKLVNILLIPVIFTATLLLSILRWLLFSKYFTWSEIFLIWPMLSILPLISLCLPILWTLSNAYGLSQLELCFIGNDDLSCTDKLRNVLKAIVMPYSHLKYDVLHSFGIVSAVCAVDKEYVLTSGFPSPEKVFFFRSSTANEKDNIVNETDKLTQIEVIPEILDLTPNSAKDSGLNFDDPNWQQYVNSLKPIGLNVAITSHAVGRPFTVSPPISWGFHTFLDKTRCCCSLSQEIGVSRYANSNLKFRNSFVVLAHDDSSDIQTASESSLVKIKSRSFFQKVQSDIQSHLLAVLCQDHSQNNILMSSGSADFICKYCSDYWDGQDLQPMSDNEIGEIIDFFTRRSLSSYCIALSYNPLFNSSISLDGNVGVFLPQCMLEKHSHYSSLDSGLLVDNVAHVLHSLSNQVFVGMVSLQYYPKPDIVSLVQDLRNCGIRFIHFTAENEVRGKIFAEKLGLEAGWNCHISLSPYSDAEYEFDSESISSSASSLTSVFNLTQAYIKAKLPKGVDNVRSHLKNVDNVPLLVPLFTDCSPEAVEEMFKIMQENGEVLLCIGNAAVVDNLSLFKHADIGLSILPAGSDLRDVECSMHPKITDDNDASSPMGIAASLNSMTCELHLKRNANVSLHRTIIKARHLLGSIQKCVLFVIGVSMALSCLLLLSIIFFLPSPLSSSHLFWLMLFSTPILSVSLLFSRMDAETETLMPDRAIPSGIKEFRMFFVYFLLTFFPASVVSLLVFALCLDGLCRSQDGFTCNFIFGNTNGSQNVHLGWKVSNLQGHVLAQDCTMFMFTLYMITFSMLFIHHTKPMWMLYKYISWPFILSAVLVLTFEVCYFAISQVIASSSGDMLWSVSAVPLYVWLVGFAWPVLQVVLQELVKYHMRKRFIHSQRKLRLSFQTKLGMNSPF